MRKNNFMVEMADGHVELWCVHGIQFGYFPHKIDAEAAARVAFPDESEDRRYARIYFKRFYPEFEVVV